MPAPKDAFTQLIEKINREATGYSAVFGGDSIKFHFPEKIRSTEASHIRSDLTPVGARYTQQQTTALSQSREIDTDKEQNLENKKESGGSQQVGTKASSTIQSAAYWPSKEYLVVSFKSGATYDYKGVDVDVITLWESATSAGSFFYYNIRTSFPYTKVG